MVSTTRALGNWPSFRPNSPIRNEFLVASSEHRSISLQGDRDVNGADRADASKQTANRLRWTNGRSLIAAAFKPDPTSIPRNYSGHRSPSLRYNALPL
ncbi:hypothetical protein CDAR_589311 [Caerostris darwini]|uniref:Uncharacterized protein n=1 Tax=Caerostris darwini TaxID=1538125 RepID=A0AAV4T9R5_9ARAC|nr:hypothetical protein CDAR_589311 [Caerostris darwini]